MTREFFIKQIIREFISEIMTYQQVRDLVHEMRPELEVYFHHELRDAIMERLERLGSKRSRQRLAKAYKQSLDDERELGD